jgi:hypothetical protein
MIGSWAVQPTIPTSVQTSEVASSNVKHMMADASYGAATVPDFQCAYCQRVFTKKEHLKVPPNSHH